MKLPTTSMMTGVAAIAISLTGAATISGSVGHAGSARAFASIAADGTFTASKNIRAVSFYPQARGAFYCIVVGGGIDVARSAPIVMVRSSRVTWINRGAPRCPSNSPFISSPSAKRHKVIEVDTRANEGVPFRVVIP